MTGAPRRMLAWLTVTLVAASVHGQDLDSLSHALDPGGLPDASEIEDRTASAQGPPVRGSLLWRTGWSGGSGSGGTRHALRAVAESDGIRVLLAGDHDAGEPPAPWPRRFDHLLVSAAWKVAPTVTLVVGSYRLRLYHGLAAGSGRFGTPGADAAAALRTGSGPVAWAGASEDLYRSGLAVRVRARPGLDIVGWVSRRRLDAATDTVQGAVRTRWTPGGIHVTATERVRMDRAQHREAGLALTLAGGPTRAGVAVVLESYSEPFCPSACSAPGRFRGGGTHLSTFVSHEHRAFRLSAECAPGPGGVACVAASRVVPVPGTRVLILARSLPRRAYPLFAAPPVLRSGGEAERGILIESRIRLRRGLFVAAGLEQATYDHGEFRLSGREIRSDLRLGAEARSGEGVVRALLLRSIRSDEGDAMRSLDLAIRQDVRLRIHAARPLSPAAAILVDLAWSRPERRGSPASAVLSARIRWRPGRGWHLDLGTTEHGVSERPVVVYEPDTPLAYPLRSLGGTGRRIFGRVEWESPQVLVSVSLSQGVREADAAEDVRRASLAGSVSIRWRRITGR